MGFWELVADPENDGLRPINDNSPVTVHYGKGTGVAVCHCSE